MTGSGTQADPYIITTMSEFVTAAAEADAYLSVANDIYCKDDPVYQLPQNVTITMMCTQIQGNGYNIYGLNTSAVIVFYFYRSTVINNLGFLSWVRNAATGGSSMQCNASWSPQFYNCRISFLIKLTDSTYSTDAFAKGWYPSSYPMRFVNCSIYISYSTNNRETFTVRHCAAFFPACVLTNCYVVIDSPIKTFYNDSQQTEGLFNNSTLVILNLFSKEIHNNKYVLGGSNSVFYIQGEIDYNYGFNSSVLTVRPTALSIVYNGLIDTVYHTTVPTNYNTNVSGVTTTQIKDKSYLESIGFIP